MKTALKVAIEPWGTTTTAKAGIGIFGLQVLPTAIMMLIFWPVVIPQIWGIVQQSKLDEEALRVIEDSLNVHTSPTPVAVVDRPIAGAAGKFCANCGGALPAAAKFCSECGTRLLE